MKSTITLTAAVLVATLQFLSASQDGAARMDIVETLKSSGQFEILCSALTVYELDKALKEEGPTTLFAPTDEAFDKLPKGVLEELLKPENKDQLFDILAYHITFARVPAEAAGNLMESDMLNGKHHGIAGISDNLFLKEAALTQTDILCSNGIIHAVDTVLAPPSISQSLSTGAGELSSSDSVPAFEIKLFLDSISHFFTDWKTIDAMGARDQLLYAQ